MYATSCRSARSRHICDQDKAIFSHSSLDNVEIFAKAGPYAGSLYHNFFHIPAAPHNPTSVISYPLSHILYLMSISTHPVQGCSLHDFPGLSCPLHSQDLYSMYFQVFLALFNLHLQIFTACLSRSPLSYFSLVSSRIKAVQLCSLWDIVMVHVSPPSVAVILTIVMFFPTAVHLCHNTPVQLRYFATVSVDEGLQFLLVAFVIVHALKTSTNTYRSSIKDLILRIQNQKF